MPLLRPLGIELPITPVLFEQVLIDPGMDIGAPPVFSDLVSHQYVSPRKGELLFGSSAAEAEAFPVVDPDTFPQRARNSTIELIAENALHRFPGIERPRISTSSNGVVDSTTDNNPILSGTDFPGLFVAAGMSGHGFKLSPAIGQFMADLTLGREISIPNVVADDFRLTRFAEGDLLVSPYVYSGSSGIR